MIPFHATRGIPLPTMKRLLWHGMPMGGQREKSPPILSSLGRNMLGEGFGGMMSNAM